MKRFTILTLALIATSALYAHVSLADRDATPEESARVVEVLTALGCPEIGEVEFDDDGYFEAEDVKCEGSDKKYEIHLDRDMNIIKKIDDD